MDPAVVEVESVVDERLTTSDDWSTIESVITPDQVNFCEPTPLAQSIKRKGSWRLSKSIKRTERGGRQRDKQFELDSLSLQDIECTDPVFDTSDDDFHKEVVHKTHRYLIGKREAEVRVLLDRIVEKKGGDDEALLFILSQDTLPDRKVEIFTNVLLHRGANPSVCGADLQTPLHHAARRNLFEVCRRLVEHDAIPNAISRNNLRPLTWAVKNDNDQIGSLLLESMTNADVRSLFISSGENPAEFRCKDLLDKNMEETIISLFDCMVDRAGSNGRIKVYYSLLEYDSRGRTPANPLFEGNAKSVLYHIAKKGNKNPACTLKLVVDSPFFHFPPTLAMTIIYHEAVRLLLRKKWKDDMRLRFMLSATFYLLTLFALTYSAVVASMTLEPAIYDSPLQISRAVFEVFAYVFIIVTFLLELNQLRRQTGAYAHILWRVLSHDIVQFMMFFLIILLAFSGSYLLALRVDNSLGEHPETSTFWWILFTGFRTLIETGPVVEDYMQLPNIGQRSNKEFEEFEDFKGVLAKWDSPPLHTKLRRIETVLDATHVNQTAVLQRLAWQEKALLDIQNRLQCLVSSIKPPDKTVTES